MNLAKGVDILQWNLEYRRDPDLALLEQWARAVASYNLGHGRVNRLIATHGDRWREALPQANRRYLDAVMNLEVTDAPNP